MEMACQFCSRVYNALSSEFGFSVPRHYDKNLNRFIRLGPWEHLKQNKECSTCSKIVDIIIGGVQNKNINPSTINGTVLLLDCEGEYLTLRLDSDTHEVLHSFTIHLVTDGASKRNSLIINQHWADIKRAMRWIKACHTEHGKCKSPVPLSMNSGLYNVYFISVSQRCLVQGTITDKYVALSYVWGAASRQYRMQKAHLPFLRSRGGLGNSRILDAIPGTIERAMVLTSLLQVDLLWVDALCIIHDDPLHSASQIDGMANIYSNAYLTLCAADGMDNTSGLQGIPQCSYPRNVQQDILDFTGSSGTVRCTKRLYDVDSVYNTRGWTFQERISSRRTLIFTQRGLEWKCLEMNAQEQMYSIQTEDAVKNLNLTRADTLWPCLKKYSDCLKSYLHLDFTYDQDILRAFSGILHVLASSMPGGFLFGLPEEFFDAALLWAPQKALKRRQFDTSDVKSNALPSWSWAGWKGRRTHQLGIFGTNHIRSTNFGIHTSYAQNVAIFSCTTWFKADFFTSEKVEIKNN